MSVGTGWPEELLLCVYVLDLQIGNKVAGVPALVLGQLSVKVMSSECLAPQCRDGECECVSNYGTSGGRNPSGPVTFPPGVRAAKYCCFN